MSGMAHRCGCGSSGRICALPDSAAAAGDGSAKKKKAARTAAKGYRFIGLLESFVGPHFGVDQKLLGAVRHIGHRQAAAACRLQQVGPQLAFHQRGRQGRDDGVARHDQVGLGDLLEPKQVRLVVVIYLHF